MTTHPLSSRSYVSGSLLLLSTPAIIALLLISQPAARAQGLDEPFSYSNGQLTSVSGGAWRFWDMAAGNATVVNGAARFDGSTDLIRTFPAVLTAPGATATFSFTLNIAEVSFRKGFEIAFVPASAPFGPANTNYGNSLVLQFDYDGAPTGMAGIGVAEGLGNGNVNFVHDVGSMSLGATHSIDVSLSRGGTNTAYSFFLDNIPLRNSSFVLTDPRAINAVEIDQAGSFEVGTRTALIDNLRVTPEPSTCLFLVAGGIPLLNTRRRHRFP